MTSLDDTYAQIRDPLLRLMDTRRARAAVALICAYAEPVGAEIVAEVGPDFLPADIARYVRRNDSVQIEVFVVDEPDEQDEAEQAAAQLMTAEEIAEQAELGTMSISLRRVGAGGVA
jgi:hypothetical protein